MSKSAGYTIPFKKEIVVADSSGKNVAYYAISSSSEDALKQYLNDYHLSLNVYATAPVQETTGIRDIKTDYEDSLSQEETAEIPEVAIELIRYNIEPQYNSFSLSVKPSSLKGGFNQPGTKYDYLKLISYTTYSNYMALSIKKAPGGSFSVYLERKYQWSYGPFWLDEGSGFVYVKPGIDRSFIETYKPEVSRLKYKVYTHSMEDHAQYEVFNRRGKDGGNVYTNNCTIGVRDWNVEFECFVGTAPAGTEAFEYDRNFYYTPCSTGEKCPREGSWFDGASCFVMDIPEGLEPYIWGRNWLVKTDKKY